MVEVVHDYVKNYRETLEIPVQIVLCDILEQ